MGAFAASLALSAAAAAFPALVERRWIVDEAPRIFAATVAPRCLTHAEASVEADGNLIIATDTPACTAELQQLSRAWLQASAAGESVVTLSGSQEALLAARQQLERRFGRSPNPRLRFLTTTQHCRCLVMTGTKSQEASLPSDQDSAQEEAEPRKARTAPLMELDAPQRPGRDRGLIWKTEPLADPPLAPPGT